MNTRIERVQAKQKEAQVEELRDANEALIHQTTMECSQAVKAVDAAIQNLCAANICFKNCRTYFGVCSQIQVWQEMCERLIGK